MAQIEAPTTPEFQEDEEKDGIVHNIQGVKLSKRDTFKESEWSRV